MRVEELAASAQAGGETPAGLSAAAEALWLTKAGRWEEAHEKVQAMGTPVGDWIHGLLHLIEGDAGNAAYWYARVKRPRPGMDQAGAEWERIAAEVLQGET